MFLEGDGVFVERSDNILIQGNVIEYGETNIEFSFVNNSAVIGNFMRNPLGPFPRGQHFQAWNGNFNLTVSHNYVNSSSDGILPADQEDAINFGVTTLINVSHNYIVGGKSPVICN